MNKKILFILHSPPPVHGSSLVGKYIKDSDIINKSFDTSYINLGTSKSIDEIGRSPQKKTLVYISILWQTFKFIIKHKPNLCYIAITVKGIGFYKDAPIAIIAKLFGTKIIYHLHNKGVASKQNNLFDNLLYKLIFRNSETILLSKYLYADIKKFVPELKVHYCPNGTPKMNKESLTTTDKHNNCDVQILFLSNLIEAKGVYVLLQALKILKQKKLQFYCTFVGGQGDITSDEIRSKIKSLQLDKIAHYVGRKYGAEKDEIFRNSDIFVFPTFYHNECFPLVLLEAMQYQLPIISTFEGGIRDMIEPGHTGYLVKQKDVNELANKLEILISNDKLRKEMGQAGRKKFEKNFTLKIFEQRITNILTKVLNES